MAAPSALAVFCALLVTGAAATHVCGVGHPDHPEIASEAAVLMEVPYTARVRDGARGLQVVGNGSVPWVPANVSADAAPMRIQLVTELLDGGDAAASPPRACATEGASVSVICSASSDRQGLCSGGRRTVRCSETDAVPSGSPRAEGIRNAMRWAAESLSAAVWVRRVAGEGVQLDAGLAADFGLSSVPVLPPSDLIVVLTARPVDGEPVAGSGGCRARDQWGRCVVGLVNLVPAAFSPSDAATRPLALSAQRQTAIHEMIHVLGGMAPSESFRVFATGAPAPAADVFRVLRPGAFPVDVPTTVVVTPRVLSLARAHFGCPSLPGLPLEDQPLGRGAHWEARVLGPAVMAYGTGTGDALLTAFTLAFLEDTHLYSVPDYAAVPRRLVPAAPNPAVSTGLGGLAGFLLPATQALEARAAAEAAEAEPPGIRRLAGSWGRDLGCGFVFGRPAEAWPLGSYTCPKAQTLGCTPDRRQRAVCVVRTDWVLDSSGEVSCGEFVADSPSAGSAGRSSCPSSASNDACAGGSCVIPSWLQPYATDADARSASGDNFALSSRTGGFSSAMDFAVVRQGFWSCLDAGDGDGDAAGTGNSTLAASGAAGRRLGAAGGRQAGGGGRRLQDLASQAADEAAARLGGQEQCESCRCFESSLAEFAEGFTGSAAAGTSSGRAGLCYRMQCVSAAYLQVSVRSSLTGSAAWYRCPEAGGELSIAGFTGSLVCPPAAEVCTHAPHTGKPFPETLVWVEWTVWGVAVCLPILLLLVCGLVPVCRACAVRRCKICCGVTLFAALAPLDPRDRFAILKDIVDMGRERFDIAADVSGRQAREELAVRVAERRFGGQGRRGKRGSTGGIADRLVADTEGKTRAQSRWTRASNAAGFLAVTAQGAKAKARSAAEEASASSRPRRMSQPQTAAERLASAAGPGAPGGPALRMTRAPSGVPATPRSAAVDSKVRERAKGWILFRQGLLRAAKMEAVESEHAGLEGGRADTGDGRRPGSAGAGAGSRKRARRFSAMAAMGGEGAGLTATPKASTSRVRRLAEIEGLLGANKGSFLATGSAGKGRAAKATRRKEKGRGLILLQRDASWCLCGVGATQVLLGAGLAAVAGLVGAAGSLASLPVLLASGWILGLGILGLVSSRTRGEVASCAAILFFYGSLLTAYTAAVGFAWVLLLQTSLSEWALRNWGTITTLVPASVLPAPTSAAVALAANATISSGAARSKALAAAAFAGSLGQNWPLVLLAVGTSGLILGAGAAALARLVSCHTLSGTLVLAPSYLLVILAPLVAAAGSFVLVAAPSAVGFDGLLSAGTALCGILAVILAVCGLITGICKYRGMAWSLPGIGVPATAATVWLAWALRGALLAARDTVGTATAAQLTALAVGAGVYVPDDASRLATLRSGAAQELMTQALQDSVRALAATVLFMALVQLTVACAGCFFASSMRAMRRLLSSEGLRRARAIANASHALERMLQGKTYKFSLEEDPDIKGRRGRAAVAGMFKSKKARHAEAKAAEAEQEARREARSSMMAAGARRIIEGRSRHDKRAEARHAEGVTPLLPGAGAAAAATGAGRGEGEGAGEPGRASASERRGSSGQTVSSVAEWMEVGRSSDAATGVHGDGKAVGPSVQGPRTAWGSGTRGASASASSAARRSTPRTATVTPTVALAGTSNRSRAPLRTHGSSGSFRVPETTPRDVALDAPGEAVKVVKSKRRHRKKRSDRLP